MGETWERPYTPGPGRWLVIGWEAMALALLAWTTVRRFELSGHGVKLVTAALAVLWLIGAYRIVQMGAYVGARSAHPRPAALPHAALAGDRSRAPAPDYPPRRPLAYRRRHDRPHRAPRRLHARPALFRAVYHELRSRHLAAQNPSRTG